MAFPSPTDRRWMWAVAGFAAGLSTGLLLPALWGPTGEPTVEVVPGAPGGGGGEEGSATAAAKEAVADDPPTAPAVAAAGAAVAGAPASPAAADASAAEDGVTAAPPPAPVARSPPTVRISSLTLYPIKSCAGVSVPSATVSSRGFVNDRAFLIVDFTGRFLTQRKLPRLALLTPTVRVEPPSPMGPGGDVLVLAAPGVVPLDVPVTPVAGGGKGRPPPVEVVVWRDTVAAVDQGDAAAAWLAAFLEQPGVRLVRMANDARRPVEPGFTNGPPGAFQVAFADRYPWLLASEASLADLNDRMAAEAAAITAAAAEPVAAPVFDMRRFRPNVVVAAADGPDAAPLPPWVEDTWKRLSVGAPTAAAAAATDGGAADAATPVVFRVAEPCDRCKVPTLRPDEGAFDAPAVADVYHRTMDKARRVGSKVMFGMNLVCDSAVGATVSVGDIVSVEAAPNRDANGGD